MAQRPTVTQMSRKFENHAFTRVFPRLRYIKLIHTELPLAGCDKFLGENQPVRLLLVVRIQSNVFYA